MNTKQTCFYQKNPHTVHNVPLLFFISEAKHQNNTQIVQIETRFREPDKAVSEKKLKLKTLEYEGTKAVLSSGTVSKDQLCARSVKEPLSKRKKNLSIDTATTCTINVLFD